MADIEPSDPSLVAPVAVIPIRTIALEAGGLEKGGHEVIDTFEGSANHSQEAVQSSHPEDGQRSNHALSQSTQSFTSDGIKEDGLPLSLGVAQQVSELTTISLTNVDPSESLKHSATGANPETISSIPSTVSNSPVQQHATASHSLYPPQLKRFTSANVTKRFLEKTPSTSGPSLGATAVSNTNPVLGSSTQRRGISPNSRSPSFDRPVSSRLVTAKLTAVSQPSSASTAGWLRPGQTTNSSATSTPPSTSPQPPAPEFTTASLQSAKRRPGISPAPNGTSNSVGLQNNKLVWSRGTPSANSMGRNSSGLENQNDFPTAAEAVHSMQINRKPKPGKGEVETETSAAAHRTAQRNAETAAAFRGAHLNTNTPHWDEMSDEDSEDFDGVIEFGDGTQYKIEQKTQEPLHERPKTPSESEGLPVTKEERFGEDMGRNWPRGSATLSAQPSVNKPSLQLSVSMQSASESPSQTQSPHDGTSPTSRVLFNERLNRLESLADSNKAPYGSRQREPSFSSQPHSSNIQLLQKGVPGADFKSRPPPRSFGSNTERVPWNDNAAFRGSFPMKDEERPWESRRRESVSSAAGSSIRDRSRGRENRWEPPSQHTIDRDRDNISRASNVPPLPSSLTRERDGIRGTQFRAPFAPGPPSKGSERDNMQSNLSNTSPAISARSLHSPVLEKTQLTAQSIDASDNLDKDALLKDAMHLANERARRRKQELDEEEKRRGEAAERARKKAEALALAMEGKKVESQASPMPSNKSISGDQMEPKVETATMPTEIKHDSREQPTKPPSDQSPSLLSSRRQTALSPATQADSWRNKAYPKTSVTETESPETVKSGLQGGSLVPPKSSVVPPPLPPPLPPSDVHDLLLKPDEQVEVVDFEDLGRFLGNTAPEMSVSTKPPSKFSQRPVASDFFKDDTVESEAKNDGLSWRRTAAKLQSAPVMDELRTQTIPIFPTELSPEVDTLTTEPKGGQSPPATPSRRLSYGDQASNNPQISPVLSALRSPRISHFKEAPMSALTDTMSRIKGALDGMQYQDISSPVKDKTPAEKPKLGVTEPWRASRDDVSKRPVSATLLLEPEEFVTRAPPPVSPKPVWNTYAIKVPKLSQQRESLSKKQLHYFNLPYPPVRWDILVWDPPVEGMNKRDLSRDDIFHKKNLPRNGKLRVLLPRPKHQQIEIPHVFSEDSSTTLVTDAGVKIKLPAGPSTFRPAITIPQPVSTATDRSRDLSNVPSWRRSANPLTSLKKEQVGPMLNGELSTTSRSPPPDPSTPLPQFTHVKKETPAKLVESSRAATVSLPPTDLKLTDSSSKGPRDPVSFHCIPDSRLGGHTSTKPLSNFTVNSELESSASEPSDQTIKVMVPDKAPGEMDMKPVPVFTPVLHEAPGAPLPRLMASKSGSKSSEESTTRPETPPPSTQQHTTSPWGKALAFPVIKDSPTRRVPDPEHLKAVWSQPTSLSAGNTLNSLKGITDELPFIPSAVQDMKSEDGETPPPTAPAPPSRLSQQEVARAFQQVPEPSAPRPPTYTFLSQHHRPNHPMLPPPSARPGYPPSYHPHSVMGHSPSPTLVYAPGMVSPIPHQRIPVSGPSPPVTSGVWLPTPPPIPSQPGSYLRPGGIPPPPTQMAYPSPGTAPNQMVHHRIPLMAPGTLPPAPPQGGGLYTPAQMHHDLRNMHMRSPHMAHATAAHPHGVPMQPMQTMHHHHPMFSPPPPPGHPGQPQHMYALPVGAGRGALMPRNGYEGYPGMSPSPGYPNPPYMFQS